jgi:hypothetical protein
MEMYSFYSVSLSLKARLSTMKYEMSAIVGSPDGLYCVCRSPIIVGQGILVEYEIVLLVCIPTVIYVFCYTLSQETHVRKSVNWCAITSRRERERELIEWNPFRSLSLFVGYAHACASIYSCAQAQSKVSLFDYNWWCSSNIILGSNPKKYVFFFSSFFSFSFFLFWMVLA